LIKTTVPTNIPPSPNRPPRAKRSKRPAPATRNGRTDTPAKRSHSARRADSGHSLQPREARVRKEQAALHRPFDQFANAALWIKVSNAQGAEFAKLGPLPDSGPLCKARRMTVESPRTKPLARQWRLLRVVSGDDRSELQVLPGPRRRPIGRRWQSLLRLAVKGASGALSG